jgi:hypothetical protein
VTGERLNDGAQCTQDFCHGGDVGNTGHVLEDAILIGEEARSHHGQDGVLVRRYINVAS